MDSPGFNSCQGKETFSSLKCLNQLCNPPSLLFNGCQGSLSWINWPAHEADYSPPSSAEVQKQWSYMSTPASLHILNQDLPYFPVQKWYIWKCWSKFTITLSAEALLSKGNIQKSAQQLYSSQRDLTVSPVSTVGISQGGGLHYTISDQQLQWFKIMIMCIACGQKL